MNGMHGIIFSYDKENGLRELIENRVHGSIPFGGDYRIIDFILSSMVNAGVTDVGVIMHGKCESLLDDLGSGKSWDLSRNFGGLTLLPAFAYNEQHRGDGQFRGRVDALGSVMNYLKGIRQDYVVLSDSDTVINAPLEDVLRRHIDTGADITAVCTAVPGDGQDTYLAGRPGPHHRHGLRPAHAGGLSLPEHLCPADRAAHPAGDGVPEPQPLQPAAGCPSGHEQPPPPAKLRLRRLRRPYQHPAELLRPQHGAAGHRHPQRPVLPTVRYTARKTTPPPATSTRRAAASTPWPPTAATSRVA